MMIIYVCIYVCFCFVIQYVCFGYIYIYIPSVPRYLKIVKLIYIYIYIYIQNSKKH